MKMKKFLCAALSSALVITALAGCGGGGTDAGSADSGSSANAGGDVYTVGISQFAEHGSLDNCREGFIAGLKEAGISEDDGNLKVLPLPECSDRYRHCGHYSRQLRFTEGKLDLRYRYFKCSCRLQRCYGH